MEVGGRILIVVDNKDIRMVGGGSLERSIIPAEGEGIISMEEGTGSGNRSHEASMNLFTQAREATWPRPDNTPRVSYHGTRVLQGFEVGQQVRSAFQRLFVAWESRL